MAANDAELARAFDEQAARFERSPVQTDAAALERLVAFAAQAHDVPMIGILGTVADYTDPVAYKKSAERARRFGFSGGTCVHPGLVQALNEAFTPDAKEVAYAQKLIAADERAAAEGRGSFSVDGKMIDIPVIERARRLIKRHDAIERRRRV